MCVCVCVCVCTCQQFTGDICSMQETSQEQIAEQDSGCRTTNLSSILGRHVYNRNPSYVATHWLGGKSAFFLQWHCAKLLPILGGSLACLAPYNVRGQYWQGSRQQYLIHVEMSHFHNYKNLNLTNFKQE